MFYSIKTSLLILSILITAASPGMVRATSEPTIEEQARVVEHLRRLTQLRHGLAGMRDEERALFLQWLRDHAEVVRSVGEHLVSKAIRGEISEVEPANPIATQTLIWAMVQSDSPNADESFKRLFDLAQLRLQFTDALYRPDTSVNPAEALGLRTYSKMMYAMLIRRQIINGLTQLKSPLLVDEALALLPSDMSTRLLAVSYLLAVADSEARAAEGLREAYADEDSWLFQHEILVELVQRLDSPVQPEQ